MQFGLEGGHSCQGAARAGAGMGIPGDPVPDGQGSEPGLSPPGADSSVS